MLRILLCTALCIVLGQWCIMLCIVLCHAAVCVSNSVAQGATKGKGSGQQSVDGGHEGDRSGTRKLCGRALVALCAVCVSSHSFHAHLYPISTSGRKNLPCLQNLQELLKECGCPGREKDAHQETSWRFGPKNGEHLSGRHRPRIHFSPYDTQLHWQGALGDFAGTRPYSLKMCVPPHLSIAQQWAAWGDAGAARCRLNGGFFSSGNESGFLW